MSNYPSPAEVEDLINRPRHYAEGWSNGAEVLDITENLNFNRGNAVKYVARAGKKNPETELEDLKKAQFYINREIERVSQPPAKRETIYFVGYRGREWKSLRDVPEDLEVYGKDDYVGDEPWLGEGPDGIDEFDEYGPFYELPKASE